MLTLKRLISRWIAPALAAGATLAIAGAGLSAPEAPKQAEQIDERIDRLIEQLGHEDYFVREKAQAELAKLSFEAFDALSAATTDKNLEIAARAKYLLQLMRVEWTTERDAAEVKKLLAGYETLNGTTKLARMRSLAQLPKGMGIPALCRLVRYEKSPVLSKQAAIELLSSQPAAELSKKELGELFRKNLGRSRRPGATWLLTWLRFRDDAEAALADWTKLVEAEYSLLGRSRTQTSPEVLARLVRVQVEWLQKLNRKDQALAAMYRLIDLETGSNPQAVAELLNWLIEQKAWDGVARLAARLPNLFASNPVLLYTAAQAQAEQGDQQRAEATADQAFKLNPGKGAAQLQRHLAAARALTSRKLFKWAEREYHYLIDQGSQQLETVAGLTECLTERKAWKAVDELAAQFPTQFAANSILLYALAQAKAEQGNSDEAEQTAQRALQLNPGNNLQQLIKHYLAARALAQRGRFTWSQQEYRHVIDTGEPGSDIVTAAQTLLSEMLHDLGDELQAAELLQRLIKAAENKPDVAAVTRNRLPALRARMNFFFACHFKGQKDRAKQREHLDRATAADSADIDALIARYRLPDQTPEYRKETVELVREIAARFRAQTAQTPDNPTPYNQFAWLVANTEGDLDAALSFSKKSIELRPDSGGFHDTLAHVYFARGDYENAVKTQTKAAQLEPHTRAITRQLEVFRKKLEEAKKQGEP